MSYYGNPKDGWENYQDMPPAPAPKVTAAYQADGLAERVIVPALKAAIVAIVCGLLSGLLIGAFSIPLPVLYTMPIVTLSVFLLVFWGSSNRGQWLIERLTGADLNSDGFIGQPTGQAQLPMLPAAPYHVTEVWVHDDPENQANARRVDLQTPKDDTLERMAVILAVRGWSYFTCDNFTNAKSETQLMSYDHWQKVFFPAMQAARLVESKTDSMGRKRVELSGMGKEMMTKLAGAVDKNAVPASAETVYAQDTTTPLPRSSLSKGRKA